MKQVTWIVKRTVLLHKKGHTQGLTQKHSVSHGVGSPGWGRHLRPWSVLHTASRTPHVHKLRKGSQPALLWSWPKSSTWKQACSLLWYGGGGIVHPSMARCGFFFLPPEHLHLVVIVRQETLSWLNTQSGTKGAFQAQCSFTHACHTWTSCQGPNNTGQGQLEVWQPQSLPTASHRKIHKKVKPKWSMWMHWTQKFKVMLGKKKNTTHCPPPSSNVSRAASALNPSRDGGGGSRPGRHTCCFFPASGHSMGSVSRRQTLGKCFLHWLLQANTEMSSPWIYSKLKTHFFQNGHLHSTRPTTHRFGHKWGHTLKYGPSHISLIMLILKHASTLFCKCRNTTENDQESNLIPNTTGKVHTYCTHEAFAVLTTVQHGCCPCVLVIFTLIPAITTPLQHN